MNGTTTPPTLLIIPFGVKVSVLLFKSLIVCSWPELVDYLEIRERPIAGTNVQPTAARNLFSREEQERLVGEQELVGDGLGRADRRVH